MSRFTPRPSPHWLPTLLAPHQDWAWSPHTSLLLSPTAGTASYPPPHFCSFLWLSHQIPKFYQVLLRLENWSFPDPPMTHVTILLPSFLSLHRGTYALGTHSWCPPSCVQLPSRVTLLRLFLPRPWPCWQRWQHEVSSLSQGLCLLVPSLLLALPRQSSSPHTSDFNKSLLFGLEKSEHMYACVHAQSLQSNLTLCEPMDCGPPGSSVHGILQARILEWVAMPSSRGSFWLKDWTRVSYISCTGRWVLYHQHCMGILNICQHMANSLHCPAETNFVNQLFSSKKKRETLKKNVIAYLIYPNFYILSLFRTENFGIILDSSFSMPTLDILPVTKSCAYFLKILLNWIGELIKTA